MWTLLGVERGDLPFGIRAAAKDFDVFGLRRGDGVSVRSGFVGIGVRSARLVVDCRAAPRWIPTCQGELAPGLLKRLNVVAAVASHRSWHSSSRLALAVVSALSNPDALVAVLADVVGCGPGSTPAGDDVLLGVLAVLTSPHAHAAGFRAAQSLRSAVLPLLPRTTDISGHLLRQAAHGWFSQDVHELVSALIGDSASQQLRETAHRLVETGGTSGADMCVGLLAAAPSFLVTHDERVAA
jgi:hypothetical protein